MINKYAATCARCGSTVPAGAGQTNRGSRGGWITVHGQCPARAPQTYSDQLSGLHGSDYDEEFYSQHGMTQSDYRDVMNPDEGDR